MCLYHTNQENWYNKSVLHLLNFIDFKMIQYIYAAVSIVTEWSRKMPALHGAMYKLSLIFQHHIEK